MALLTKGFNSGTARYDHWDKHHGEFEPPPLTVAGYEARADAFLGGVKVATVLECVRTAPDGRKRTCRYDRVTREYGVLAEDGVLLTYFKASEDYFHRKCV